MGKRLVFVVIFLGYFFSVGSVGAQEVASRFDFPVSRTEYKDKNSFLEHTPSLNKYHLGEDWNVFIGGQGGSDDLGDPIHTIANGRVTYAQNTGIPEWGYIIIIEHTLPDGTKWCSKYAHVEDPDNPSSITKIKVIINQLVSIGQPIGSIGDADGFYPNAAHLHFAILNCGKFPEMKTATGRGYVSTLTASVDVTLINKHADPTMFISTGLSSQLIPLSQRWTSFVNPFDSASNLNDGKVRRKVGKNRVVETIAEAIASKAIRPIVFERVNNTWQSFDLRTTSFVLKEGRRYWIYSIVSDASLMLFGSFVPYQQAQNDMIAHAATDTRFLSAITGTFGKNVDWGVSWELRWMNFNFVGSRTIRIYHATSKANISLRYTIFFDPDTNAWSGWSRAN